MTLFGRFFSLNQRLWFFIIFSVLALPAWSISGEPWHAVLSCQTRTDVTPPRPGFRLKLPDFRFDNERFTVANSYKEATGTTVSEIWEGLTEGDKLTISGKATRSNSDSWSYSFSSQANNGDMFDLYGAMFGSDGKKIRQCSLNLTTLLSDLTKTWDATSEKAPIEYLLSNGQRWHYETSTPEKSRPILERPPASTEQNFVQKVEKYFQESPAKAIAVIDGSDIVFLDTKFPANRYSRFLSFSMGKTITTLAIGKAMCEEKISLDDRIDSIITELTGTPLGTSQIKDLLTMSSGTWEGFPDSSISTLTEDQSLRDGKSSYLDLLNIPRINSFARNSDGELRKPGLVFAYHSTDPLTLGLVINKVSGQIYAKYVESQILFPAGIRNSAVIGQDHYGYGAADGNVRLRLEDWARLAMWVLEKRKEDNCFGKYIKQATTRKIENLSQKIGPNYGG